MEENKNPKLHPDIPVTHEFDGCEPPEDDGTGFNPPPSFYMDEPEIAYTGDQIPQDQASDEEAKPKRGRPPKKKERPEGAPAWWDGRKVDTTLFCEKYLEEHELKCINGTFFTTEGIYPVEQLKCDIYHELKEYVRSYAVQTAANIVENLKAEAYSEEPLIDEYKVNLKNGTYDFDSNSGTSWTTQKFICRNRLPVTFTNVYEEPKTWVKFVNELLEPEDVLTLQEFMGYCLLPTTRAQKMLIITGNGGEGKSRIGVVMRAILGANMNYGSIPKLETNSFARADLEHKLLMVDDDVRLENLPTTGNLKALITSEGPMDLEKKGVQSYQGIMYCRLMAFSNGNIISTKDDSNGFFRRQIILSAKPRPRDRVDDPFLSEKLTAERDQIFVWATQGYVRLVRQDFHFTQSKRAKENLKNAINDSNNVYAFLHSEGCIAKDPEATMTSRELYNIYRGWCEDNAENPLDQRRVISYMKDHAHEYGLTYKMVPFQYKYVRGFKGVRRALATPINPVKSA